MPSRHPGAPRLIEWTGERAVPWAPDIQTVHEHFHRYLWARTFLEGRRVLDIGCGEGFGAALIGDVARSVLGVDSSAETIEHCRLNYASATVGFDVGSAQDLHWLADSSFDAVVAFEVVEHVEDQQAMLREISRLVTDDGLVFMSTPDRPAYAELTDVRNPFHVHELAEDELRALLGEHFDNTCFFGQRSMCGSRIEARDDRATGPGTAFQLEPHAGEWRESHDMRPVYLVAVASRRELPALPRDSALSDFGQELVRVARSDAAEAAEAAEAAARGADEAARSASAQLGELRVQLARKSGEIQRLDAQIASMQTTVVWRLRGRVHRMLGGTDSSVVRTISRSVRRAEQRAARRRLRPVAFPVRAEPIVSIVIAVHDGFDVTARCLRALSEHTGEVPYEVIVVDDGADTATRRFLGKCKNVRVLVNERNLGFLRSVNRGCHEARGRWIALLNNDTEPQPQWLSTLLRRAQSDDSIGVVVPKLTFPDGRLQEAGSIVWRDGSAWNYGCEDDADAPAYNFVRDVDYGSAAALMIDARLWGEIGGFDERYAPGYYEDVDFCFAARDHGRRVVFEPRSSVVHVRGASMGTDVGTGLKRHQELNRHTFVDKWMGALERQLAGPSQSPLAAAADRRTGARVVVFDSTVPTHDQDAGSLRMYHLVHNLCSLGFRVSFVPSNLHRYEPYAGELQAFGVEVLYGDVDVGGYLTAVASETEFVIVSRPDVASRFVPVIRECMPDAPIVYDTVDLHHVREARRAVVDADADRTSAASMRELENRLVRSCDLTLTVSEAESQTLLEDNPGADVAVVPLANDVWTEIAPRRARSGLLFVGNFHHAPNVDAVGYLVREIMPRVWREEPDLRLSIVGGFAPSSVTALADSRVGVLGWVRDLDPLLGSTTALVAPLRFGAGVKGKVTQALAAGLPVVTTSLGAEGIDCSPGEDILVGDTADDFAQCVLELVRDEGLWQTLSRNGQKLAREICSPEAQREAVQKLLVRLHGGHGVRRSVPASERFAGSLR